MGIDCFPVVVFSVAQTDAPFTVWLLITIFQNLLKLLENIIVTIKPLLDRERENEGSHT